MNYLKLYTFMAQKTLAVVATIGPDWAPQSALVGIAVTPNLEIVFDTDTSSRKYHNLIRNPPCSLVVGWSDEQTLQFEGTASIPEGDERNDVRRFYLSVWKDGQTRAASPNTAYVIVRPSWIRFSDYSLQPPAIEEFYLGS